MFNKKRNFGFLGLGAMTGAATAVGYSMRRQVYARVLGLPAATHAYEVDADVAIRMPDGVRLMHDHYRPNSSTPLPTILIRTPYYRKASFAGFAKGLLAHRFVERGYNVIIQDTRGRGDSEGVFHPYINEADDGAATIKWIAEQEWSDGQVGMHGQSYVGYVGWAAASRNVPQLKGLFQIITQSRLGGPPEHAYPLDLAMRWLLLLDAMENPAIGWGERIRIISSVDYQNQKLKPAFESMKLAEADRAVFGRTDPVFQHWLDHADEDDPHWEAVDHRDIVAGAPPAHFIGGWYDIFINGMLDDYRLQREAGKHPRLTIGNWHHMDVRSQVTTIGAALDWFDAQLKGQFRLKGQPVRLQIMPSNEWRTFDAWPPEANEIPIYLAPDALQYAPAAPSAAQSVFNYNPHEPTPNVGGALLSSEAGAADNAELEARGDVQVFTTEPFQEPTEVIGHLKAILYVKTTADSADIFGRINVVKTNGKSLNLCDGLIRLKPERGAMQPDGTLLIEIDLGATAYRFAPGERLRLLLSGGAHPRHARNPGVNGHYLFIDEMVTTTTTIYHDTAHPSRIIVPIR